MQAGLQRYLIQADDRISSLILTTFCRDLTGIHSVMATLSHNPRLPTPRSKLHCFECLPGAPFGLTMLFIGVTCPGFKITGSISA